ncbi:MAG: hypothetical protein K5872_14800 [Rhizobiaceae bacterium]|nr:hypothetical protein [Rhizobiaceae bacterium]MCV0407490.1 hypothetical protein [Rhizobiaceae bacterium]
MSDDSTTTVSGIFTTREDADRAVEHLVQEFGINRSDVFLEPAGDANSSGAVASGGDAESDPKEGSLFPPKLGAQVKVTADVARSQVSRAQRAFAEAGAESIGAG